MNGRKFQRDATMLRLLNPKKTKRREPAPPTTLKMIKVHETKMFEAAHSGDLEQLKTAISGGAVVDAKDEKGNTPLLIAANRGDFKMVKFLVDKAKADVNVCNDTNYTAIELLPKNEKSIPIVSFLRRHGAKTAFEQGLRGKL